MSSSGESIATPLLRGVLAALGALLTAIAIVAVTALAAQLVAERSTATALDAILIALNILVLGLGGGIMLHTGAIEGATNLTPLGLTLLLIMVVALSMRRAMVLLEPVEDDGGLRPAALRDSGAAVGALTVTFAIGTGLLAALGRSPDSSPVVLSAHREPPHGPGRAPPRSGRPGHPAVRWLPMRRYSICCPSPTVRLRARYRSRC